MLKSHLRRDLRSLKRQARKDRWITVAVLAGVAAAWVRQLPFAPAGSDVLFGLSFLLMAGSGVAWLVSACHVFMTIRRSEEPASEIRRISITDRAKEWAFRALGAYAAWHLLHFLASLLR
ncbi:hypothetical protein ITP53_13830 [Nonomuraea sp. K274]|uniref:Uncharacterized protein n=1 Tax=Nonomuraea cypriaca TaxID=1187855 RepID=A0A931EYS0_9ACTN|nr:hypothetical protein [Nonomuraea cypriaca]MBF8186802.1 hypothetical protein [Nonomuraea cypriaca]